MPNREVSVKRLLKDVRRVLEHPFWIPEIDADTLYERTHDDHDGTWEPKIRIFFDRMGDAYLMLGPRDCLRFRTYGGGGRSMRVRNALLILAEAIRLDNEERPEPKHNDEAQTPRWGRPNSMVFS